MRKAAVKFIGRKFTVSPNATIRKKIYTYRKGICFSCYQDKKLGKSVVLYSNKSKTCWNKEKKRWLFDMNDYIWLCKECTAKKEPDYRIRLFDTEWEEIQKTIYQFT